MEEKKLITKKSLDISKWYLDVIKHGNFADYGPVKGTMIIKPYGYAIWENIQEILNGHFKRAGIQNAYFPLFIPYSFFVKEKEHVKGFSPELALVTQAGGERLEEVIAVRPTSETIMYYTFSKWISSYKDLPLKINQWCNVVRWEKRTYPFLRTSEFLWQEGHTVHATEKEAKEMVKTALSWYKTFYEKICSIAVYAGKKSSSEKFAGAVDTYAVEMVIPDGKALQGATSHNLGQNFSKAFNIQYLDNNNKRLFPFQTSWGITTRAIGGLILIHGDDHGAVIPPLIAPIQIIILVVPSKNAEMQRKIEAYIQTVSDLLKRGGFRFVIDRQIEKSLGYRMNEWEIKGVPIRIEIGTSEYEHKNLVISRRDKMEKIKIKLKGLEKTIQQTISEMQNDLYNKSLASRNSLTVEVSSYKEFKNIMKNSRKFIRTFWCESPSCEKAIKQETKATTRLLEYDQDKILKGKCIFCKKDATHKWLFAQAY